METKVARRDSHRSRNASPYIYNRQHQLQQTNKVCSFWLADKCSRNPCRFLHSKPTDQMMPLKRAGVTERKFNLVRDREDEAPNHLSRKLKTNPSQRSNIVRPCDSSAAATVRGSNNAHPKICQYWVNGNCVHGEKCKSLHSWSHGSGFSRLALLEGHKKAVTGIVLPFGSDKLFTGSKDGFVRIWNCHTGVCAGEVEMGSEVGCLLSEGPWVFVGITNAIKAWNVQDNVEHLLCVSAGQVYSLAVGNGFLFSGVHDGSLLLWKFISETSSFEMNASLKGHTGPVVSLTVGCNRLYSGSVDNTIKVWDLDNLQCILTLNKHSEVVMSMVCWDQFLLSGSLDRTLKIWAATESGILDVTYTHIEEHGILALSGLHDAQNKPILLCSCNDNTVRLYELPSFVERGRIFTKQEVRSIGVGPGGLFFTGDGTGQVSVWRFDTVTPDA